jgi:hypothetical protein
MATFISADGKSYITVPDQKSSGTNMLDSHGRIIGVVQSNGNILSPNGTLIGNTQDRKY